MNYGFACCRLVLQMQAALTNVVRAWGGAGMGVACWSMIQPSFTQYQRLLPSPFLPLTTTLFERMQVQSEMDPLQRQRGMMESRAKVNGRVAGYSESVRLETAHRCAVLSRENSLLHEAVLGKKVTRT